MSTRTGNTSSAGSTLFAPVMTVGIGLLVFTCMVVFAPSLAGAIENSQPSMSASSDWNKSHNQALPSGTEQWTTGISILGVVILILSISIALFFLRGMG